MVKKSVKPAIDAEKINQLAASITPEAPIAAEAAAPVKRGRKPAAKSTAASKARKPAAKKTAATAKRGVRKPAVPGTAFRYFGRPGDIVFLAGDFNNWAEYQLQMKDSNGDGNFVCEVKLAPGTYEYKFIVNGNWCIDNNNPCCKDNQYGTGNSFIVIE